MADLQRLLHDIANARRAQLLPTVYHHTTGRVQNGPFRGMIITPHFMWGDGDTAAKLMGVYEDELHSSLERALALEPDVIINVGAAEGYYAVGIKMLSSAYTMAVDTEPRALEICKINALANGVTIDEYVASMDAAELESRILDKRLPCIISDCEGYEAELLDPVVAPSLARALMLVETHDVFVPGLTRDLMQRFQDTHHVTTITQSYKDPYKFSWTTDLSDCDKWALVHEGRPMTSSWLWMVPRHLPQISDSPRQ
jgi:hypothetical protein